MGTVSWASALVTLSIPQGQRRSPPVTCGLPIFYDQLTSHFHQDSFTCYPRRHQTCSVLASSLKSSLVSSSSQAVDLWSGEGQSLGSLTSRMSPAPG